MKIVAIIGSSGVGKTHLINTLLNIYPYRYHKVLSATTRPPRDEELVNKNKDHYFVDKKYLPFELNTETIIAITTIEDEIYYFTEFNLKREKINLIAIDEEGLTQLQKYCYGYNHELKVIKVIRPHNQIPKSRKNRYKCNTTNADGLFLNSKYLNYRNEIKKLHEWLEEEMINND